MRSATRVVPHRVLVRLNISTLEAEIVGDGDLVVGLSPEGLVYTRTSAKGLSDLIVRDIPGSTERRVLRMRGWISGGAMSPDGSYAILSNLGYLHDPIFVGYGPSLHFVCSLASGRAFVVDLPHDDFPGCLLAWFSDAQ
ncbi:MAG: hypothetical protein ACUVXJ_12740 [Phycisphaerae bacterium]